MYPDDRPCFIARSAVLKKKKLEKQKTNLQIRATNSKFNLTMQRCSETKGTHKMKVEREDWSQQYRHRRGVIGYIPVTRWHKARVQLAGSSIIECILVTR